MSKGQEEVNAVKNGPVILQGQAHGHSPCVSDSSDVDEDIDEEAAVAIEFFIFKQNFYDAKTFNNF